MQSRQSGTSEHEMAMGSPQHSWEISQIFPRDDSMKIPPIIESVPNRTESNQSKCGKLAWLVESLTGKGQEIRDS